MPGTTPTGHGTPGGSVRAAVVWDHVSAVLAARTAALTSDAPGGPDAGRLLDVVDLGGGTGGLAVPVALAGHHVTVVDPSPDALAALARRAREAGVADRVVGVQGDAGDLSAALARTSADGPGPDVVLCHGVLEHVDDPAAALRAVAQVLRPGGMLSLLVAQRIAAVLARAVAGRFAAAARVLADPDGRGADRDARRFDRATVQRLLEEAGLRTDAVHGVRMFTDLVPAAVAELDADTSGELLALERLAAADPTSPLVDLAGQLHVVATRK